MWWRKKANRSGSLVLRCSFCNKAQDDVPELIAGPAVFICSECVAVCNDILADTERFEHLHGKPVRKGDGPRQWPNMIPCGLCGAPIPANEAVQVPENRGILCAACVNAIQASNASGR